MTRFTPTPATITIKTPTTTTTTTTHTIATRTPTTTTTTTTQPWATTTSATPSTASDWLPIRIPSRLLLQLSEEDDEANHFNDVRGFFKTQDQHIANLPTPSARTSNISENFFNPLDSINQLNTTSPNYNYREFMLTRFPDLINATRKLIPERFEDPEQPDVFVRQNGYYFQRLGWLAGSLGYSHLVFTVNFTKVLAQADTICHCADSAELLTNKRVSFRDNKLHLRKCTK
jgi:hypothetical protein